MLCVNLLGQEGKDSVVPGRRKLLGQQGLNTRFIDQEHSSYSWMRCSPALIAHRPSSLRIICSSDLPALHRC